MALTLGDVVFALIWFFCGVIVFQTRGKSKEVLAIIGTIIMIASIISLLLSGAQLYVIIGSVVINKITGVFTDAFYFLGANISRGRVMNRWSVESFLIYIVIIGVWLYFIYYLS